MHAADVSSPENWHGGFYEISIRLGARSDDRLESALQIGWTAANIDGCSAPLATPPEAQVPCTLASLLDHGHLRGVVDLPTCGRVVCGAVAIREDEGDDWLDLYVPLGALAVADPRVGGFPFGDPELSATALAWRRPLDDWFSEIGQRVFAKVSFIHAVIGFEVSGQDPPVPAAGSSARWYAALVPDGGSLTYLPIRP